MDDHARVLRQATSRLVGYLNYYAAALAASVQPFPRLSISWTWSRTASARAGSVESIRLVFTDVLGAQLVRRAMEVAGEISDGT